MAKSGCIGPLDAEITEEECQQTCTERTMTKSECQKPTYNLFTKKEDTYEAIWCEDVIVKHRDKCNYTYKGSQIPTNVWTQHGLSFIYITFSCELATGGALFCCFCCKKKKTKAGNA